MTDTTARPLLPMAGLTHGNRSPLTCHLRCGDACSVAAPNSTETSYFRDVAAQALRRRTVVGASLTAAAIGVASTAPAAATRGHHPGGGHGGHGPGGPGGQPAPLAFTAI